MSGSGDPPKPPPADQQGQQGSAGASSPAAPVAGRKDGWDKLAALTTLISSVVIGGAGVAATYIYNNHELQIKHQEKEAEEKRISEQAKTAYLLETNRRLEALFKYVVSDKTNEREFGYAMFQALGQEDLAVKIIALRRDQAGEAVARSATHSANPQTAAQAKAISSGLRLRNWLSTGDGTALDQSKLADWRAWRDRNSFHDVLLVDFLYGEEWETARQKALTDLRIP